MATPTGPAASSFRHLLDSAWQSIGRTAPDKNLYWGWWKEFCREHAVDPCMRQWQGNVPSIRLKRQATVLAFAALIRQGRFHHGRSPGSQTVSRALREVAILLTDRGFADPRRATGNSNLLDRPIQTLLKRYQDADQPPQCQLPLPIETLQWIAVDLCQLPGTARARTRNQAAADLIVLAFFFLLRVIEYTPKARRRQRTVPLRKKDVILWNGATPIDREAPLQTLLAADAVTICIENQKNGTRGQTLRHGKANSATDPVSAAARRMHNLHGAPGDTGIFTVIHDSGTSSIRPNAIRSILRMAAHATNLHQKGFPISRIGSHSLRVGGAMAMYLAGCVEAAIKKLGRWKTETYLTYIHPQIAAVGLQQPNLADSMATPLQLLNLSHY